jgi:Copper type II ascorbate-dependent monooxygenase, C-terminal domain
MRTALLLLPIALLLPACTGDGDTGGTTAAAIPTLDPPADGEGFQVSMSGLAPGYSEVWLCEVYELPTDDYAAVHSVEWLQNEGTHHMTMSTLGLTGGDLAPGSYDCNDLYGDSSLMQDQIMFFGNQGSGTGTMTLPDGVAANMPPALQVIQEVHYVNAAAEDVPIYSILNAYTIPQEDVTEMIWGGSVRDETIEIPPQSTKTEWSRCVFNEDVDVIFLASHTHKRGINFTIAPFDGKTVGDVIFENTDWHDPKITQFDPPLHMPAGTGFEWTCTWENTGDTTVTYGLTAEDEMCNLAEVHTPFSVTAACEVVETSDGVLWK